MRTTSRHVLLASAISASLALVALPAIADSTNTTNTNAANTNAATTDVDSNMGVKAVDAGKLINENVYDAKGDKVGDIESVIVDTSGKVTAVVLDVGGWLSSDKRISVAWKDLKSSPDGKITSTLTKEQAQAAADYKYRQDTLRGKVQTANGELYNSQNVAAAPSPSGTGAPTTNQATTAGNTSKSASQTTSTFGTPIKNADGSLNASQVIGMKVVNNANESIGKIGELVMASDGKVSGVVVDVGGFLGIGTHPVLLDWKQISLVDKDGTTEASVNATKDQLKQMPAYTAAK